MEAGLGQSCSISTLQHLITAQPTCGIVGACRFQKRHGGGILYEPAHFLTPSAMCMRIGYAICVLILPGR